MNKNNKSQGRATIYTPDAYYVKRGVDVLKYEQLPNQDIPLLVLLHDIQDETNPEKAMALYEYAVETYQHNIINRCIGNHFE